MIILMILCILAMSPAKAINAEKFLYCENKDLQRQKLEIRIDKEQKQDSPNMSSIEDMQKNLNRVNTILTRACEGFNS